MATAVDYGVGISIDDLISTFRDALVAVVPAADRAGLTWSDENSHDDWERLAECLFDVFVASPIRADPRWTSAIEPLPRYDFDIPEYGSLSWIEVIIPERPARFAFVRLLSREEPFDALQVVQLDQDAWSAGERSILQWASGMQFRVIERSNDGKLDVITFVNPSE